MIGPRRHLLALAGALLAAVFIAAGLTKIADPQAAWTAIERYRFLPAVFERPTAIILPWWELYAGVAVLIPGWRAGGALVCLVLSACFAALVTMTLLRGIDASCGCLGPLSTRLGWAHVGLNVALGIAAISIARCERDRRTAPA